MSKVKKGKVCFSGISFFSFGILGLVLWGLTAPSLAAEPQFGGTLKTALASNPRVLDPHMSWEGEIPVNTYNSLLRWNKDMTKHDLDLAESLERPDDETYVFKLRKGVRFHNRPPVNGRELTSEDVKYSVERVAGMHGQKALFGHSFRFQGKIASISTPDKYTVVFKTNGPYAPFLNYLCSSTASVVPREAVEKFGDLRNEILGTGPFMLKEYVRGSHISLVRNPEYFRKPLPYLDGIHFALGLDQAAFLSNLLTGGLDFTQLWLAQVPTIKEKAPQVKIVMNKSQGGWGIHMRVSPWFEDRPSKSPMDKVEVRKAIALAIDKTRLNKVALNGCATEQVGIVPANWPPYSLPTKDQVGYNPEKAKRLLAEAGYSQGINIELIATAYPDMTKIAQVIKEMLKEADISVELKLLEAAQWQNRYFKYDYQLALVGLPPQSDPSQVISGSVGRNAPTYRWNNKEIWKMDDEQNKAMDLIKRAALIQEIQRKIIEDGPVIALLMTDRFWAFQPSVFPKEVYNFGWQNYFLEETWMAKK